MNQASLKHTSQALRHIPKQQRGERRVEQILRSAEAVFAEVGYEHATTNAVAAHAGISIGSLYQFFASKDALLEAMAQRYLDQTRHELVEGLDNATETDLRVLLERLVKRLVALQDERPYFLQCLSQNRAYAALSDSVAELQSVVARHVQRLLERLGDPNEAPDAARRAMVCVHVTSALLPLAVAAKGRSRAQMIEEIITVLVRYVGPTMRKDV